MDTPTQPSFIPKKPISGVSVRSGAAFGMFFMLLSVLIFIASLIAAGAAFLYQGYLQTTLNDKKTTLTKAEAAFDPSTINDLENLDSRINNAQILLQKHITALAVFSLLSELTLQDVQFTDFSYTLGTDGSVSLTLTGEADSFSTLALQSDQFNNSKSLRDIVFSGVKVGQDGKISFDVKATVPSDFINYAKNLTAAAATSTP